MTDKTGTKASVQTGMGRIYYVTTTNIKYRTIIVGGAVYMYV